PGYWRDIGTPDSLAAARRDVREIPAFKNLITSWPAPRGAGGGRIRICRSASTGGWRELDILKLRQAPATIWTQLSRRSEGAVSFPEVPGLSGVEAADAQAALVWLAREGRVRLLEGGRVKAEPTPSELAPSAR